MIVSMLLAVSLLGMPPGGPPPKLSDGCDKICKYAIDQCLNVCKEKATQGQANAKCNKNCKGIEKPCMERCAEKQRQRRERSGQ